MATWFPVSQLLLVALLSWNVLCFPAKKGWSQRDPHEGGFSSPPGLHYGSSQGAPAQPSSVSYPAASYPYASEEGVYSGAGSYPGSSSSAPGMSSAGSSNSAPGWSPVEESTYTVYRSSQPTPDSGFPAPSFYQAGELDHYEANMEHGNSEVETEELSLPVPPPPPPPFPEPGYQAGEMSHYESVFEHGNEERETEEQGFMPPPPFAAAPLEAEEAPFTSEEDPEQPAPQALTPLPPSFYYLFLTGQLPPGTYTHFQSNYEQGRDHWDEDHYERYHYPEEVQSPAIPSQTQQDYTKV